MAAVVGVFSLIALTDWMEVGDDVIDIDDSLGRYRCEYVYLSTASFDISCCLSYSVVMCTCTDNRALHICTASKLFYIKLVSC